MSTLTCTIPIRAHNAANGSHGHWGPAASRKKKQRSAACHAVKKALRGTLCAGPVTITITRIGPRRLDDHDGLPNACKSVVDGVSDALGMKDNNRLLAWKYAQEHGEFAVRIQIEPREQSEMIDESVCERCGRQFAKRVPRKHRETARCRSIAARREADAPVRVTIETTGASE